MSISSSSIKRGPLTGEKLLSCLRSPENFKPKESASSKHSTGQGSNNTKKKELCSIKKSQKMWITLKLKNLKLKMTKLLKALISTIRVASISTNEKNQSNL